MAFWRRKPKSKRIPSVGVRNRFMSVAEPDAFEHSRPFYEVDSLKSDWSEIEASGSEVL